MKVLSLFSGIGAFEKALEKLNINYELVNYCEIDKYASKSYSLIHNVSEDLNLGDIRKVDTSKLPKDIDLITYGFPCQDISLAGKQKGLFNIDGSYTRSGLFFESLRIIEDTQPKVAIAENVKNLVSKKFNAQFQVVLSSLESVGYNNYYKVLNAKDYGIPQNRERVFIVSIRKDIDPFNDSKCFEFPKPIELSLILKDLLEDEVDEKYFLNDVQLEKIVNSNYMQNKRRIQLKNVSDTLCARDWKDPKCVVVGYLKGGKWDKMHDQSRRVYSIKGISPTIHTSQGGNTEIKIAINENTKRGYSIAQDGDGVYINRPHQKRGVVQKNKIQTLKSSGHELGVVVRTNNSINNFFNRLLIRKLTPKEYWRLMGFEDIDIDKCIDNRLSNTQLYKQAGNSIVVNVLEALLKQLFKEKIWK